jgi:hypothetical protein
LTKADSRLPICFCRGAPRHSRPAGAHARQQDILDHGQLESLLQQLARPPSASTAMTSTRTPRPALVSVDGCTDSRACPRARGSKRLRRSTSRHARDGDAIQGHGARALLVSQRRRSSTTARPPSFLVSVSATLLREEDVLRLCAALRPAFWRRCEAAVEVRYCMGCLSCQCSA